MIAARRLALLCVLCLLAGHPLAQGVVVEKSQIRFAARQMGVGVEGAFRKWKADVAFNPKEPAKAKIAIDVDVASIDLASEESETEVKGKLWFDSSKFPVAKFVSTSVKDVGGGKFEVAGTFTLKGISRDIVVPITVKDNAAEGTFTLKRLDYKIGEGTWSDTETVGNDVLVRVKMALASAK